MARRELYPEIEPFDSGHLKVSDLHEIYYEQCGKKGGKPVVFVHGGPGGGFSPNDRRFFDPEAYHIVLFDQRGAGKSRPAAELKDIEKLRKHCGVDKWVVFGGSWGSTLSLIYAETHPDRVKALVLRGIFNLRRSELLWYYQDGASHIFPDMFDDYVAPIPEVERHDMMSAYYRRLTGTDEETKLKVRHVFNSHVTSLHQCARAWSNWEMCTSRLHVDAKMQQRTESDIWSLQFARIECHYFVHGGFFRSDAQILEDASKLKGIPGTIVQGRYDVVCPARTAWQLHKAWPQADFHIIPDAGHSAREPGIVDKLVQATDKYRDL